MNIVLIGFKNVGKTKIGKELAKKMKKEFIDTDDLIENHFDNKYSCFDIFKKFKEKKFREIEQMLILNICSKNSVIATGGGASFKSLSFLKQKGVLVYLKAEKDFLKKRAFQDKSFIENEKMFFNLFQKRTKIYEKIACFTVEVDGKNIDDITKEIKEVCYGK